MVWFAAACAPTQEAPKPAPAPEPAPGAGARARTRARAGAEARTQARAEAEAGRREGHVGRRRAVRLRQVGDQARWQAKLDDLATRSRGVNLEVVIAIGHADSIGSDAYNQKLSVRRAESVKAYLVSKGIEANRIYTEGKGEKQPVADNKTREGRAKNRRVEIEVIGTPTECPKQVNSPSRPSKPRFGGVFHFAARRIAAPSGPCRAVPAGTGTF